MDDMNHMSCPYFIYDVFTRSIFGGNQLAIIPEAQGLSSQQMHQIAREFNSEDGKDYKLRIFTPGREMPFAGHPNLGTAIALLENGFIQAKDSRAKVCFEEMAGNVQIHLQEESPGSWKAELKAPALLELGNPLSPQVMAGALSLDVHDIETATHPPISASVGLPFVIVEVKNQEALARAHPNNDAIKQLKESGFPDLIHVYCKSNDDFDLRTRMFAPLIGIQEDPATGSANCTLAGLLAHYSPNQNHSCQYTIAQGMEMQRPSTLFARAEKSAGKVTACYIGGHAVKFAEGQLKA